MPLLKSEKKKSPPSRSVFCSRIDDGVSRDNSCVCVGNVTAGKVTSLPIGIELGVECFRANGDVAAVAAA